MDVGYKEAAASPARVSLWRSLGVAAADWGLERRLVSKSPPPCAVCARGTEPNGDGSDPPARQLPVTQRAAPPTPGRGWRETRSPRTRARARPRRAASSGVRTARSRPSRANARRASRALTGPRRSRRLRSATGITSLSTRSSRIISSLTATSISSSSSSSRAASLSAAAAASSGSPVRAGPAAGFPHPPRRRRRRRRGSAVSGAAAEEQRSPGSLRTAPTGSAQVGSQVRGEVSHTHSDLSAV